MDPTVQSLIAEIEALSEAKRAGHGVLTSDVADLRRLDSSLRLIRA